MKRVCVCVRVSGRSWQWWQECWFRVGRTIKRSKRERENYVIVIVNHGWRAYGESQRRQARGPASAPLSLSNFPCLPPSLFILWPYELVWWEERMKKVGGEDGEWRETDGYNILITLHSAVVGEERGPGHSTAQPAASQTLQIFLNLNFSYFPVCIRRWKIIRSFVLSDWGYTQILVYLPHLRLPP